MPAWTKPVFSKMVSDVGWEGEDPLSGTMLVTFAKSGKTAAYSGVPEGVAIQMTKSPSVGTMMNEEIKGQYSFRYV